MKQGIKRQKNKKRNRGRIQLGGWAVLLLLLFRIPLTNQIGDIANGYFAAAWEMYLFFLMFFAFSYEENVKNMVETRMVREQYRNGRQVLKIGLQLSFLSSLLGAGIMYLSSGILMERVFHMKVAGIPFRYLAVLLLLQGLAGCFRGYFEGMGTEIPTDISRLLEALATVTGAFLFSFMLKDYGLRIGNFLLEEQYQHGFTAGGVVLGYVLGALFALLFLLLLDKMYQVNYKRQMKDEPLRAVESRRSLTKQLVRGTITALAGTLLLRLYHLWNIALYARLRIIGEGAPDAVASLGIYYGKYLVVITLPIVALTAMRRQKLGKLAQNFKRRGYVQEELQQLVYVGLPVSVGLMVLSSTLMRAFFTGNSLLGGKMLQYGGLVVLLASTGIYLGRLLFALGEKKRILPVQLLALLLQTLVLVLLLKKTTLGAVSLAVADVVFWLVIALGEGFLLRKVYRVKLPLLKLFGAPLIGSVVMALVAFTLSKLLSEVLNVWVLLALAVAVGSILYFLVLKRILELFPFLHLE